MIDIQKFQNLFSKPSVTSLDKKIFKLLKAKTPPESLFNEIKNHSDTEGVSRFLFNSGLCKVLLFYSLMLLKNKHEVSWHYVIKVFIKYNIYPSEKELIKALFHKFLKKNKYYSLFACEEWGNVSPEFQQMRNVFIDKLETMNVSEEKKLLEQLAFVQAKQMMEDEEEIINQLIILNPANESYRELKKDLDEKKALFIIKEYKKSQSHFKKTKQPVLKHEVMSKNWEAGILEMSKSNPSDTKELALFLCFCDNLNLAVHLLEKHISALDDYWYYIDWTLETKQFSKGLNVINYIESSKDFYHFDSVELLYKKAQFLYGLGKEDKAIEYLYSISQFYPDYKNINYLLVKWSKNASVK